MDLSGKKDTAYSASIKKEPINYDYRKAYFEDFDGKYYSFKISVGKNTEGIIYNVNTIKEASVPQRLERPSTEISEGAYTVASSGIVKHQDDNVNDKLSTGAS